MSQVTNKLIFTFRMFNNMNNYSYQKITLLKPLSSDANNFIKAFYLLIHITLLKPLSSDTNNFIKAFIFDTNNFVLAFIIWYK